MERRSGLYYNLPLIKLTLVKPRRLMVHTEAKLTEDNETSRRKSGACRTKEVPGPWPK